MPQPANPLQIFRQEPVKCKLALQEVIPQSQSSSIKSLQLLSFPSQTSVDAGLIFASLSLQSVLSVTYPVGCSQVEVELVELP